MVAIYDGMALSLITDQLHLWLVDCLCSVHWMAIRIFSPLRILFTLITITCGIMVTTVDLAIRTVDMEETTVVEFGIRGEQVQGLRVGHLIRATAD